MLKVTYSTTRLGGLKEKGYFCRNCTCCAVTWLYKYHLAYAATLLPMHFILSPKLLGCMPD